MAGRVFLQETQEKIILKLSQNLLTTKEFCAIIITETKHTMDNNKFDIDASATYKQQGVYFSTSRGAKRAIEEVIKPFIKEHPDFVW